MAKDKEAYSSDTLERSNLSSLQSDLGNKKSSESNSANVNLNKIQNCFCQQHTFGSIKFVPCPLLNGNLNETQHPRACPCQRFPINERDFQKQNENTRKEWRRFNWKWPRQSYVSKKDKYYPVKSKNKRYFCGKPPFTYSESLDGIPRSKNYGFRSIIENPMKHEMNLTDDGDLGEKIEIYYFDHGNSAYYHTTDIPPILATERFAEKTNSVSTRFWAEIFGYLNIVASVITAFILQFVRCILFSFLRPLTVGVIQLVADYFIKPFLSITFNGLIQPIFILLYNMATSFRDCCEPLAEAFGFCIKELAVLFRACRLIEITHNHQSNATDT